MSFTKNPPTTTNLRLECELCALGVAILLRCLTQEFINPFSATSTSTIFEAFTSLYEEEMSIYTAVRVAEVYMPHSGLESEKRAILGSRVPLKG